jgi:hypothetical protein
MPAFHLLHAEREFREENTQPAGQTRWLQLRTGEPPVLDCAFEVEVGNAAIVVKQGFDLQMRSQR